jgi:CDP-L-myo-inositol myo-inositolphosphotransferase
VTAVDFSAAEDGRIRFDKSRVAIGAGRVTAIGAKCGDGQCVGVSIVPDGQLLLAQLADLDTWSDIEPVVVAFQHGEIVEAVDISNLPWITVRDSTTLRKSEAVLMNSLRQSYDGWIASAIYRPISLRLSIQLAPLGISPTAMNVAAFMSFAGAGLLLATTSYANHLLAALLIQLSAVLDGCDGEIARLRYMDSKRGGYVDQLLDRYGDIVVVSGISVSYLSQHFSSIALVAAIMAGFTFSVSSYVTKEYKWFTDESVASRNLRNLRRRDLRNFVLGICILVGIAFWGMIAVAVLSHIVIFIIYCQAYMRLQNPKSGHDR